MTTQQRRSLAWAAFKAGVQNGGDSSPADADYWDIQQSISVAFEKWWNSWLDYERRSRPVKPRPNETKGR